MPILVLPNHGNKLSYIDALVEFQQEELWCDIDKDFITNRFDDYLEEFSKSRKGLGLQLGFVASTEYWWVEGASFIGRIDIRHRLTDSLKKFGGHIGYEIRKSERKKGHATNMLKAVLPKAYELGIKEALITCDSTNLSSEKVILSAGGIFQDEQLLEYRDEPTRRYIVNTKPTS
jgi:predicted acetyltransferase